MFRPHFPTLCTRSLKPQRLNTKLTSNVLNVLRRGVQGNHSNIRAAPRSSVKLSMAPEGDGELRLVNRLGESRSPYVSRQYVDEMLVSRSYRRADNQVPIGTGAHGQSRGMANVGRREPGSC